MFRVGMKVVCVDASGLLHHLKEGAVYTISAINAKWGCVLIGLVEAPGDSPDVNYYPRRFRPVVNTDISIFAAMLNKAPEKSPVPIYKARVV